MIEVQENLLKILSDALWRKFPEHTYSEQEWKNILSTAEEQGVLFLVLQGCTSIRQQVCAASWMKWRSKLISTMVNNESLMEAQNKIVDVLKNENIPYAVLKGTSFLRAMITHQQGHLGILIFWFRFNLLIVHPRYWCHRDSMLRRIPLHTLTTLTSIKRALWSSCIMLYQRSQILPPEQKQNNIWSPGRISFSQRTSEVILSNAFRIPIRH